MEGEGILVAPKLEDRLKQWHKEFYGRQASQLPASTTVLLTLAGICITLAFLESSGNLDIGKWRTPMIVLVLLAVVAVVYTSVRRKVRTRRAAVGALEDFDQDLGGGAVTTLTYFLNLREGGVALPVLLDALEEMQSIPELSDWQILKDARKRLMRGHPI